MRYLYVFLLVISAVIILYWKKLCILGLNNRNSNLGNLGTCVDIVPSLHSVFCISFCISVPDSFSCLQTFFGAHVILQNVI